MTDAPDRFAPAAEASPHPCPEGARRHIAFFTYQMSGGGAARRTVELANGFASRGHDADLVMLSEKSMYADRLSPGVHRVVLDLPRWHGRLPFRWMRLLLAAPALARCLQVRKPDILVSAGDRVSLISVIAWLIAGRPMPLVLRSTNFASWNLDVAPPLRMIVDLYLRGLWHLVHRRATRIVAVSAGAAEEVVRLTGLPPQAVATVFEPVVDDSLAEKAKAPLAHPWLEPGQPPVLLAVGRLHKQKDYPTLLEAFAMARRSRPLRLVILGTGGLRSQLQGMIATLGVESDVQLFGYAENPMAWMARASLLVLSSVYEGLPAVLIEALASGCPVVSTNCPSGPSEILDQGAYGRLVPCRDPAALAEAILATLDAPADPQRLRDRARVFGAEASIDGYLAVFEDAIARHRRRRRADPARPHPR